MTPIELRITNFRGFKKPQVFRFANRVGLFFMQGVNEAEPRLGSNGAGKSTIWDALTWLCFGKTPRGLKAGDVCNWEAKKGTRVELDFIAASGEEVTAVRTWGPIKFFAKPQGTEDGDREQFDLTKDEYLEGQIGLTFTTWLSTILAAQSAPMFLDMKAGPQAELFSDVMQLDVWLTHSEGASKAASAADATTRRLEADVSALRRELDVLGRDTLKTDLKGWERVRADRLDAVGAQYDEALNCDTSKEDLEWAETVERNAREALRGSLISSAQESGWSLLQRGMADAKVAADIDQRELDRVIKEMEEIQDDGPCPTCGHRMSKAEWTATVRAAGLKVAKAKVAADTSAERLADSAAAWADASKQWDAAEAEAKKARDLVEDAAHETAAARRRRLEMDKYLDRLEDDAHRIKAERNPFDDLERRQRERHADVVAELDGASHQLEESERMRSLYAFWVRGFKELRLSLISDALAELEIEVNSCVEALGLVGWELQFKVDRETRGGSISRGFSVSVLSPHNDTAVPWESWSGGEAQRLRIAAQMGLADLIRSRTGCDIPLEVFDEPTAGLSPEGVNDLLEALRRRALMEEREVWVTDHRTHSYGAFDGGALIVKTPSGSRIKMSV